MTKMSFAFLNIKSVAKPALILLSMCNTMESVAVAAEQGSRLQQVRTWSNVTAMGSEIKERSCLL